MTRPDQALPKIIAPLDNLSILESENANRGKGDFGLAFLNF
jgi:hypothetical protein